MSGTTQIERDALGVLRVLAEFGETERDPSRGHYDMGGPRLREATGLTTERLNDAIEFLATNGHVELMRAIGTAPFTFYLVRLTPRGRYEYQRIQPSQSEVRRREIESAPPAVARYPAPVGSPFGFSEEDWEYVAIQKARLNTVKVVVGLQFESESYNRESLVNNLRRTLEQAVGEYNGERGHEPVGLDFQPLHAGYGEHLFNEIARDIISSDIAIFETSDLNPNVMIEMGVALTWGVRVLPIKARSKPKPPSDISGQTWVDHNDSAREFVDADYRRNLVRMIERAMRKKIPTR